MSTISVSAPAKLNLFLHIVGKRADGYHLLQSLVVFTEFGDEIECEPAKDLSLTIVGSFASALVADQNNLVLKAARALQASAGIKSGAHLTLHKHIPVAAGLGGGSADAAAALKALATLWQLPHSSLLPLALTLGSDVPACLAGEPAFVTGVGEQIVPVSMRARPWVLLVNPGAPLLTPDVYRKFSAPFAAERSAPVSIDTLEQLLVEMKSTQNDLEPPAMTLLPVIGKMLEALRALPNCLFARMSGSGATCFALFKNEADCLHAQKTLATQQPRWWQAATQLI